MLRLSPGGFAFGRRRPLAGLDQSAFQFQPYPRIAFGLEGQIATAPMCLTGESLPPGVHRRSREVVQIYPTPGWNQPLPEWLSLQQAAALYGVSVDTLRRKIRHGQLPASRFGQRLIRVRARDLDRLFRAIPTVRPIGRIWG